MSFLPILLAILSYTFPPLHLRPQTGTRFSFYNFGMHSSTIRIVGDGMGNVDCYLYGRDGKFLQSDTGTRDGCSLTTPSHAPGRYRVMVINEGDKAGVYGITVTE